MANANTNVVNIAARASNRSSVRTPSWVREPSTVPAYQEKRREADDALRAAREALEIAEARAAFWKRWYEGEYYQFIRGDDADAARCGQGKGARTAA